MITRRALFLGSAAIITTPGLLMPARKLVLPLMAAWPGVYEFVFDGGLPQIVRWGVDQGDVKGDHTVVARWRYDHEVQVGQIEHFTFVESSRLP